MARAVIFLGLQTFSPPGDQRRHGSAHRPTKMELQTLDSFICQVALYHCGKKLRKKTVKHYQLCNCDQEAQHTDARARVGSGQSLGVENNSLRAVRLMTGSNLTARSAKSLPPLIR